MPDALPAVTVPFSLMNTAFSLRHAFHRRVGAHVLVGVEHHRALLALELDRQDLALEVAGGDRRGGALVALDGERVLLRRASSPHFAATFSAVTPMWIVSNGSVSAPTIMSIIFDSPIRAPQRCVSDA